jgi:D-tyrosyl-tRNA(Tyr) deacylase
VRVLVQRSLNSKVEVDEKVVGKIDHGLVLLVGFDIDDTKEDVDYLVKKVINLRIFDDEEGMMNKSINSVSGSILSISQFTLYASCEKGNRPSFIRSMKHDKAHELYDYFNLELKKFCKVETGIFKADMKVTITNDGPITILLESRKK